MKRLLSAHGITLTTSPAAANYSVTLTDARYKRRTLAVGGNVLAAQYELTQEVDYNIGSGNEMLVLGETAQVVRTYDFDTNQVIGKSNEEQMIKSEMNNALAEQILQRLHFLAIQQNTSGNEQTAP